MWEKCDRYRQATGDNITQRMRIACWTDNATDIMCNTSELKVGMYVKHNTIYRSCRLSTKH